MRIRLNIIIVSSKTVQSLSSRHFVKWISAMQQDTGIL